MKYRNKKAIATLIVTTLIFTCGATGVQAAPAADLNIVGNVAAAPISGVSLACLLYTSPSPRDCS